tara:strand:- start:967 stop:1776 length:810 start_codon:yes stop_codon:yes gene_type:complete
MFSLGLGLTINDFKKILFEPKAFLLGSINQLIILPIIAFLTILITGLNNEIAVGIMILACCPGGVTSNMITKLAKGDTALSISYTAMSSIITVITLPIIIKLSMQYFMESNIPNINILTLGLTMFFITALPVSIGLFVNAKFHRIADNFFPTANKISTILFIIIVTGALASEWDVFVNNVSTLGPAIITLITLMLVIGYYSSKWLNLSNKKAITISIESGIQNATVGITIGNIIFNQQIGLSILSLPSGVYGILMYFISIPFVFWFLKK